MALLRPVLLGSAQTDLGSDWHIETKDVVRLIDHLRSCRQSGYGCLVGDLFQSSDGEDTHEAMNELLAAIASLYKLLLFVPGNHDLRGRDNPWASFELPKNVISPIGMEPVVTHINGSRLLLANVFYDLHFLDPAILKTTRSDIAEFYRNETRDGKHLLRGDLSMFAHFTDHAARQLTPDTQALITHVPVHPSLVAFRVPKMTEEISDLQKMAAAEFVCDPAHDEERAEHYRRRGRMKTVEEYRRYSNYKSFLMGSNVLEHPEANFSEGIQLVHGHHHRNDMRNRIVQGKTVRILTHQPIGGKGRKHLDGEHSPDLD